MREQDGIFTWRRWFVILPNTFNVAGAGFNAENAVAARTVYHALWTDLEGVVTLPTQGSVFFGEPGLSDELAFGGIEKDEARANRRSALRLDLIAESKESVNQPISSRGQGDGIGKILNAEITRPHHLIFNRIPERE